MGLIFPICSEGEEKGYLLLARDKTSRVKNSRDMEESAQKFLLSLVFLLCQDQHQYSPPVSIQNWLRRATFSRLSKIIGLLFHCHHMPPSYSGLSSLMELLHCGGLALWVDLCNAVRPRLGVRTIPSFLPPKRVPPSVPLSFTKNTPFLPLDCLRATFHPLCCLLLHTLPALAAVRQDVVPWDSTTLPTGFAYSLDIVKCLMAFYDT